MVPNDLEKSPKNPKQHWASNHGPRASEMCLFLCSIVVCIKCPSKQKFTWSLSQAVKHFLEYFCLHVVEIEHMSKDFEE